MGSFSWLRADRSTKRKNITGGDSYKILIPKEFGGGYIKEKKKLIFSGFLPTGTSARV